MKDPTIAVASGKGGTGKTLVSTSLAWCLAQRGEPTRYVDCDVEAPNGHLFLHPETLESLRATVGVPDLINGRCSGCGACQQACAFNAIVALRDRVMVFDELCHDCGACLLSCAEHALARRPREVGTIRSGHAGDIRYFGAELDVGEAKSPPLIESLLREALPPAGPEAPTCLLDAPPGTSCPAMTTIRAADRVLLVTEPTPFGLHDLELAVKMCRALGKPVAVVLNRSDIADRDAALRMFDELDAPLLAELPFSMTVARAYAAGEVVAAVDAATRAVIERVADALIHGGMR